MDIRDLVSSVSLTDIRLIERSAQLNLDAHRGLASLAAPAEETTTASLMVDINEASWDTRIETWVRLRFHHPQAEITAAVATIYERSASEEIPENVKVDFIEKIAVMAAFPYIRSQIQMAAAELRLGSVTLPILRSGEFKLPSKGGRADGTDHSDTDGTTE